MAASWDKALRAVKAARVGELKRIPRRRRLEKSVEEPCRLAAQSAGWVSRKMNGFGFRSWPDRLFLPPEVPLGRRSSASRFWVEFKRPGEDATAEQARIHKSLRLRGESVYVCHSKEEFLRALRRHTGEAIR
jgi:hypothetical protein